MNNPLLETWSTPYGAPPFSKIKIEHFEPAFTEAIKIKNANIESIVNNSETPNFENTIVALENADSLLDRMSYVFFNLVGTNQNDSLKKVEDIVKPQLTKSNDDVYLNEKLFQRVKSVFDHQADFKLDGEQTMLLKKIYDGFVRGGALLSAEDKTKLRAVNEKLSNLELQFSSNVLAETNAFELLIEDTAQLSGLPASVREAAAIEAKEKGKEGKWVFTLKYPSIWPFMTYSNNRELREKLHKAYIHRGDNNNANDNKKVVAEMANLQLEKANLLGFKSYADYVLDENMAKTPAKVYELLNQLMSAALPNAKKEAEVLQAEIKKTGGDFKLEHWDWWYYANKVKQSHYALDDEALKPYFKLENVRDGAFAVATKLYGITFTEMATVDKYHPEMTAFEVKEADGSLVGLLYTDFFPRDSKRSGAWMTEFRPESKVNGKRIAPIISIVCNFTKPTSNEPSLLSMEEVETLFHEFGHALHGLLGNTTYRTLSGTSVARDFVELPSQIMENWATEPEVIKSYAKHYKTGESIPDSLITKMSAAGKFNQGFVTVEYLAAALLDMDWHSINVPNTFTTSDFETKSLQKMGLIPEIVVRYRSTYFSHIWGGGYEAGYYGYIWAAILDSDAFASFKQKGLYDQTTAKAFRDHVLSQGGTQEPMSLYVKFKGAEPSIDALLIKRGLK